jgi:hypothetical protein
MLPPLRRMLDAENDDFLSRIVHRVVDEIRIAPCDKFTDAFGLLKPADMWKQHEVLQALIDRGPNALGCRRVPSLDVISDRGNILQRTA